MPAPGHKTGQPAGLSWRDLIDGLVERRGTLAAVALHLAEQRAFAEDVESVERGLRRLRRRVNADGGVWGARVLRCFGLPAGVAARVRWMGQYHTRFTDLPASVAEELIHPWDRPPISATPARIWLVLARINIALRRRADVGRLLEQAALIAPRAAPAARCELALVQAYALSRVDDDGSRAALEAAGAILADEAQAEAIDPHDRACLFARLIDHRAYRLNKPRLGPPDHRSALALYEEIPPDGPHFARCRRENGLGWTRLKLGERAAAEAHARASVQAAGDAGSLRMRAMALNLLAEATRGAVSAGARQRARSIAARLEDEALALRFDGARRR